MQYTRTMYRRWRVYKSLANRYDETPSKWLYSETEALVLASEWQADAGNTRIRIERETRESAWFSRTEKPNEVKG